MIIDYKITPKKLLLLMLCILLITGVMLMFSLKNLQKTNITVDVLPTDSVVTLDGKQIKRGSNKISPGTYTFGASKEGFENDEVLVNVGSEPMQISLLPSPVTAEAKSFYDNPDNQSKREELGAKRASLEGQTVKDKYPFINQLPVNAYHYKNKSGPFSLNYGFSERKENIILITVGNSSPNGRKNAISWFKEYQVPIEALDIQFLDYTNPFVEDLDGDQ